MNVFPEGTHWQALRVMPNDPVHIGILQIDLSFAPASVKLIDSRSNLSDLHKFYFAGLIIFHVLLTTIEVSSQFALAFMRS